MLSKISLVAVLYSASLLAETNYGTINTLTNGFGTVNECTNETPHAVSNCPTDIAPDLSQILDLATTNQCVSSYDEFRKAGIKVPKCPKDQDSIKGLDNTHPSGGIFALYNGINDSFIANLAQGYLAGNNVSKFNLVIPKSKIKYLKSNPELVKLLNNSRVNIVQLDTMPSVDRWMQDSFQFTTINGKPALYQLEHGYEQDMDLSERLACKIAKNCDIPYYIPPDMVDPNNADKNSLNSGGNLEVLPGGTFYRGIIKTEGYSSPNLPDGKTIPFMTNAQKSQKAALEKDGNHVLDLDTTFLHVGHVDEIINIVKTNKKAPCDFAVMIASPKKAFEIMERNAKSIENEKRQGRIINNIIDMFITRVNAGAVSLKDATEEKKDACREVSYDNLDATYSEKIITPKDIKDIYSRNCINYSSVGKFVTSDEYAILKRQNLDSSERKSIADIMEDNKASIISELKKTTKCSNPPIVEIPVFFRNGLSYTPDLVNGVVQTPPNGASQVVLPRSYFKPFDSYVENELGKLGVKTTFAHDMGYHLQQGEVHCGSNSARICKP